MVERETRLRVRLAEKGAEDTARATERVSPRGAIGIGRRAAISVSRGAAIGFGLTGSAISSAVGLAESLAQGMGVDLSIASHMANAQATQQRVADIVNAGYIPGAAGAQGAKQDAGAVFRDINAAGDAAAFSHGDVAEGLQKFVGLTGDLETGRKTLLETAKLARATGSEFGVMAEASAEVANHLGNIPNKAEAVSSVMRVIAGQGKMGALEIKDFARQMAKIAASAPRFEGDVSKTMGDLALIAQESKMSGGSASASQAATSVLAFARDFSKKATFKNWSAAGINPYTDGGHTKLRSPEELILEAIHSTKGDQKKLAQLFPSAMAVRAVNPFANIYSETKGSDDDKMRAVAAEFDRMRKAAMSATEVQRAFAAAMEAGQSKVQLANNKLDELAQELTAALLPAIAELAPAIEAMTPAIASAIGQFSRLLGIDSKADDDAKSKRKAANLEAAMRAELEGAAGQAPELVSGKGGAMLKTGELDPSHVAAIEKRAADVATELAEKTADHARHEQEYETNRKLYGVGKVKLGDKELAEGWGYSAGIFQYQDPKKTDAKMQEERLQIDELIEANKTNEILGDIHRALTGGQVRMTVTNPGGTKPGVAPAESDGP